MTELSTDERRAVIAQTLSAAGLAFDWQPGPEPVALLELRLGARPVLRLSVRHTGPVLQAIAHAAVPGAFTPERYADLDAAAQDWGLGRIYFSRAAGAWDVSVGLHAAGGVAPRSFASAVTSMADLVDMLAGSGARHVPQPVRTPEQVMPAIARAFAAAGMPTTAAHGGELVSVVMQMDRVRSRVDWFLAGGVHVFARAQPLVPPVAITPDAMARVDALNGRLDIGGVGFWYELATAYGWIAHPAEHFDATPEVIRWTSERAATWAEAAHLAALG